MVFPLIKRGLVAGAIGGLLAGVFAFFVGEPLVQDAIDIEEAGSASAALTPVLAHISDWSVSRGEQRGGLFLATILYGTCFGALFALVFAVVRGRMAARDDWQLSTRLAGLLFVALVLLPFLKYPANPPAVGDPETINERTWQYLAMLAGGIFALLAAYRVRNAVADDAPWKRPVAAGATFLALAAVLYLGMPKLDEVPADFPPTLLWEFRLSALGTQAILWAGLGTAYGILSLRAARAGARAPMAEPA
ncbi:CbtA family protein [Conexibacter sp. SYSU D00693]|uniref:CbtA family protein n=1 Tax=Conexibacter sp. SYSU D00693 TaxID=2812560 RepID=UPI00196AEE1A|nr:CbtA family protein [Conexibacter sp. SYSU D00693]